MENNKIYENAYSELDLYLKKYIKNYERSRNYDFGVSNRTNVSNLSKYISHRVINEFELIKTVLSKYKIDQVEKFIQEVFWRIYWKGWLECRPKVWNDFKSSLNTFKLNNYYEKAVNAETKLKCFNDWVHELKEFNYLHNHTRMWFASIWIFTLNLPWQLGAKFFLEHLHDADAASNTLSWRWVAGLQTKGKNYLAKSWNIEKYTNNKYSDVKLNENSQPLTEDYEYKTEEDLQYNFKSKYKYLIMFDNDLNITLNKELFSNYEEIYLVLLENENRTIKINKNVLDFKKNIIENFEKEIQKSIIISVSELQMKMSNEKNFDIIYPFVGENLDFIIKMKKKYNLNLHFLHNKNDVYCKKFSKKGFFNFKKNIPQIISTLKLY